MHKDTSAHTRRDFLKQMGILGGGLVLGVNLSGCATAYPHRQKGDFEPNAWLQITPQNEIRFYLNSVEMGQGTMTGMATLIAEELNTPPNHITVKSAGVHADYINPEYGIQVTGGSTSTRIYYESLRTCAAQAREMLISAASMQLEIKTSELRAQDSHIIYQNTQMPFGQFAQLASQLSTPKVTLKPESEFRFVGKNSVRLDSAMKAMGTAKYGIDTQIPNLSIAVLKRCPVIGGKLKTWQGNGAQTLPHVKHVIAIPNGVAVIASTYWHAQKALQRITVEWDLPELANRSSKDIADEFAQLAQEEEGRSAYSHGNATRAIKDAPKVREAQYQLPYLAHATMEPMNCTVRLSENHCEIWAPTQIPSVCASMAAEATGLSRHDVTVHTTLMGGGFGRRLSVDYVVEATLIAQASGLPIKLIFSREDDTQNDYYRPAAHAVLKAGLDKNDRIQGWYHKSVNPNILNYAAQEAATAVMPDWMPDGLVRTSANLSPFVYNHLLMDPASTEGAIEFGYDARNTDIRHVQADPGLRTGYWRSVGHSINGFVVESFVDELSYLTNKDPLEFRLHNLKNNPRKAAVLEEAANKGHWGQPQTPGAHQGIAAHYSFGSYVAQLVEASVNGDNVRVHRVVVVVDCGKTVNPDIVKMQMEGGVIFGLTAALYGHIEVKDGAVQQTNFHNYPLLRMHETPKIEVHVINSEEEPGGAGEPGVPPIAAAVANAVFAATGKRLRQLPLRLAL